MIKDEDLDGPVEWNPTGDVWELADVVAFSDEEALIKLRSNDQMLTVGRNYLRSVLRGDTQWP
jgi:hypothetical protein